MLPLGFAVPAASASAMGNSFAWLQCPFDVPLFSQHVLAFWHCEIFIHCLSPNISDFSKEFLFFSLEVVLDEKTWVLGMLATTQVSVLLIFLRSQS